jgi:hypothetical protein
VNRAQRRAFPVPATPPLPADASRTCARTGCEADGTAHPVLLLYPFLGWLKPAEATLRILVCPAHQRETSAEDLITSAGWAVIATVCRVNLKAEPVRGLTRLIWRPVSASPFVGPRPS